MKTQTIINKLEEKGYVYPVALRWTLNDVNHRLMVLGQEDKLRYMDDTDKRMILDDFFIEIEDELIELINQRLDEYLENLLDYKPSQKIF